DGDAPGYLLTGFTFANGKDDERPIDFITYTHRYDEPNDLDVCQIPLFGSDGAPVTLAALKQRLREARLPRLHVHQTIREYQAELAQYQLYQEEWQSIRTINEAEGGVGLYFEHARTTRQLIERILIPGIEQALYESEADRQELTEAFRRHRDDLLEIPVIQRN